MLKSKELTNYDGGSRTATGMDTGGKVRAYHATIDLDAAAIDTTVELVRLPKGFKPLQMQLISDNLGASTQLALGKIETKADGTKEALDPDWFLSGTASTTALKLIDARDHLFEELPLKTSVVMSVQGAVATGTVKFLVTGVTNRD